MCKYIIRSQIQNTNNTARLTDGLDLINPKALRLEF